MPRSWLPSGGPRDETAGCVDRARRGDARGRHLRDPSRVVARSGVTGPAHLLRRAQLATARADGDRGAARSAGGAPADPPGAARAHRQSGLAVLGIGASAAALAWIVFLGSVATLRSAGLVGVPAALQVGLAAFSVVIVVAGLVALVGFAAASWRLGDALFRVPRLRRYNGRVPAPLIALLGATLIYISWQLPYLGAIAVVGVLAYALGAVVTARWRTRRARRPRPKALIHEGGRER